MPMEKSFSADVRLAERYTAVTRVDDRVPLYFHAHAFEPRNRTFGKEGLTYTMVGDIVHPIDDEPNLGIPILLDCFAASRFAMTGTEPTLPLDLSDRADFSPVAYYKKHTRRFPL